MTIQSVKESPANVLFKPNLINNTCLIEINIFLKMFRLDYYVNEFNNREYKCRL